MKRRDFVKLAASGMPVAALAEAVVSAQQAQAPARSGIVAPTTSPAVKMKVGTQHGDTEEILKACAAFGVNNICQMIRNCARAGIMQVKYNFTLIGIPRSGTAAGRGPSKYTEFVYANAKQDPPLTLAGKVDADTYWERITYFLERVVPVANEYKV